MSSRMRGLGVPHREQGWWFRSTVELEAYRELKSESYSDKR